MTGTSDSSFFQPGDGEDPLYRWFRDGTEEYQIRGRAYLEKLWADGAPYVDADAPDKATRDLASVFWELELGNAFRTAGLQLIERARLAYKNNKGPDLFIDGDSGTWVEAIVVRRGDGPDALQSPELNRVSNYDPDPLILRLLWAIKEKGKKIRVYRDAGIIKAGQAVVIAISGVMLPNRNRVITPPAIVRAVYAVNNLVVEIDLARQVEGEHVQYRSRVMRKSGKKKATDVFLNPEFSHLSAVLFDESFLTDQAPSGTGFKIVHNFQAQTALPDRWFPRGSEYWWREDSGGARIETLHHDTPVEAR